MAASKQSAPAKIYHLKVWLLSHLGVWRDIEVPGDFTLHRLHYAIQYAMGWQDGHPHEFTIKRRRYTEPSDGNAEFFAAGDLLSEHEVTLADVVGRKNAKFLYLYDFGDMWRHEVFVLGTHPPEPGVAYPRCLAGEWACPPEDCGGPGGYQHVLAVLDDSRHPEHVMLCECFGKKIDPAKFDLDAVNRRLSSLQVKAPVSHSCDHVRGRAVDGGALYYGDDGVPVHPHLTPAPELCFSCSKYESSGKEKILCNLVRADKQIDEVFVCFAYQPTSPSVSRQAVLRDLCEKAGIEYSEEDLAGGEDDEPVSF